MEAIEAEVLDSGRRDTKGRWMLGEHEWNRLLDEYEKSGLTQKAFARREGLSVHTLVAWIGRRRKKSVAVGEPNKPVRFRELSLPSAAASTLEVHLPDGLVLKGGSPRDLAALVMALKS
jgi:hypothetical protein